MKLMKLKHIALLMSVCILSGCDFMDCDESNDYQKENIFTSFERSKKMVTNIYSYLPQDFCNTEGAMQDAATDDAVHVYKSSAIHYFVNGTWSANRLVDDVWSEYYTAIRAANLYLKEAEGQTFEDWENAEKYKDMMKEFNNFPYEVRFLRAFYYFELIKRYHDVPLVTTVLTQDEVNSLERESCDLVADFIIKELTEITAEGKLPITYTEGFASKDIGRITRGAALALKSRVTLYMASPLYSEDNAGKWKKAASAAYEIIGNVSELGYELVDDLTAQFRKVNNTCAEVILARGIGETGDFEKANFPMGVEGGKTSTCPTQNLVDAFEMKDGSKFDWNDPTMAANPYSNRDPRLARTVAYNNMNWCGAPLQIWEGGANGLPLTNATTTGYYLYKYLNPNISFVSGSTTTKAQHNWVLFRYAEILLNYAEAMINAFGNPDYADADYPMTAREAVNKVRARGKVEMPPYPAGMGKVDFIERLKNERRVELAFEGHRFWDVRRWKDLDKTADIYGVKVIKGEAGKFEYSKFLMETRNMTDNLYFYPISNTEKYKNPNLGQNPGW